MFSLESPQRGDSNEYAQYTISQYKKENQPKSSQICSYEICSKGPKNEFKTAVVYEPSVLDPLKFYCITLFFTVEPVPYADQDIIDYVSTSLEVSAGVVDNLNKDNNSYIVMQLKLKNNGETIIHKATWKLYFTK